MPFGGLPLVLDRPFEFPIGMESEPGKPLPAAPGEGFRCGSLRKSVLIEVGGEHDTPGKFQAQADVETIFVFSWAISFKELGWYGYFGVMVFVILLVVVLIYEWRNGALDFGPDGKKILKAYKKLTQKPRKA